MTVRDSDVEYDFDDPDEGWFGMAQPAEPAPLTEVAPACADAADTDRWFVQDMELAAPIDDRPATESVAASLRPSAPASWESRLSTSGAWDFKVASNDTRFPRRAVVIAAGIIAVAAAVFGIVLAVRGPAPAAEESPQAPPSQSASPSAPTTSAPAPVANVPLPPPPGPPPPPPPSAQELNPPVVTRQYTPRYQTPDEPKKPQTNVTRAPLSATPPPPPRNTDKGRATPGESGSHGFFG